jgi:hypothetical protein
MFRENRTAFTIIGLSAAVILLLFLGISQGASATTTNNMEIQAAVKKDLACGTTVNFLGVAIVDSYALTAWTCGPSGGETVLKTTAGSWVIIFSSGGGPLTSGDLLKLGISTTVASQLISNLNK